MIQEWWGLDAGIKEMADRLGAAGFVALAPDLYHGELAGHDEMDKAAQLMQQLPPDRAGRDMSGAVDYLAGHNAVTSDGIGVVGFCMGGMLSFIIAANRPDKVKAVVPFYGFPQGDDGARLVEAARRRSAATWPRTTTSSRPRRRRRSRPSCRAWARTCTLTVHPGTGHAFMGPHNALGTLDEELAGEDLARGDGVPARASSPQLTTNRRAGVLSARAGILRSARPCAAASGRLRSAFTRSRVS